MNRDEHGYHKLKDGARLVLDEDQELWLACCGCGLTHRLRFKIKGNKLHYRVFRHEVETKKQRRHSQS